MSNRILTETKIEEFEIYLREEEKSTETIQKYRRDVRAFGNYAKEENITKEMVIAYKQKLLELQYAVRSINSMIASLNSFFNFLGWHDCKMKSIRVQREIYCSEKKELTKSEYIRLVETAQKQDNERLSLIIQTICATGIRISELQYITVEAIMYGETTVSCKGKTRVLFIVKALQNKLKKYIKKCGIESGPVFVTRTGNPVSRTNVWKEMKNLCKKANVAESKVFPHNLRHLFARIFYEIEKDITKLADILGHSSINTTRIYTISTGIEHRRKMEYMRLVI